MGSGHRMPLEESSEWAQSDARAEDIRYVKEVLRLAEEELSQEQASVFWPMLAGASREECAAVGGVSDQTVANRLHRARSFMRRACAA
jgi:DNA-directed RNA polymerase specialized sigma24 family protein